MCECNEVIGNDKWFKFIVFYFFIFWISELIFMLCYLKILIYEG